MNGKDMFLGMNYVKAKFVDEAETVTQFNSDRKILPMRKVMLIAAIVVWLLLLAGCVAYFYGLEKFVAVDHITTVSPTEAYNPELEKTEQKPSDSPFVAEQVLSLQGYEGSPSYNALQEWLAYVTDYIAQNPDVRFSDDFQRPEAYTPYTCFSQEMVDKVDELCNKYGLHLLGKSTFIVDEAGMEANGLSGVLSENAMPRCFYGDLYQDCSFIASGELEFSDDYEKIVQFQMHNIKKDAFYTVHLGVNNLSDYVQWNDQTPDGHTALLALNDKTGLIFVENENRFISIIVDEVPDSNMVFTGLPADKQFLEMVCDCFVFSDITVD